MMFLHEGDWVWDENAFYFEWHKGKGIKVSNTISCEELLKFVYHILKVDPIEYYLSMKHVFNANISWLLYN